MLWSCIVVCAAQVQSCAVLMFACVQVPSVLYSFFTLFSVSDLSSGSSSGT